MKYEGHIEDGKVVFDTPVPLPEGAKVDVTALPLVPADTQADQAQPSLKSLLEFAGIAKDLPTDAARNFDRPNYGPESTREESSPAADTERKPTMAAILKYAGMAKDLPPDASVNLDHYLYGHPKE